MERLQQELRTFLLFCNQALALNKALIGTDQIGFHASLEQGFADLKNKMDKYLQDDGGPEEEEIEHAPLPAASASFSPTPSASQSDIHILNSTNSSVSVDEDLADDSSVSYSNQSTPSLSHSIIPNGTSRSNNVTPTPGSSSDGFVPIPAISVSQGIPVPTTSANEGN